METWLLILITITICFVLKPILTHHFTQKLDASLPPGPFIIPIIGSFLMLIRNSLADLEPILRNLHAKYGSIVTLHVGPRPAIFIRDRSLTYQALIQNGAIFADRPPALPTFKIITSNQHNISSAFYGSTWRQLRRNLTSEILRPSRVMLYSYSRKWVLEILFKRLQAHSTTSSQLVCVKYHFQYAMFCLLCLMCFGDKLDEKQIKSIETVQRSILLAFGRFNVVNIFPRLTKLVFPKRWEKLWKVRRDQEQVLIPLINARKTKKMSMQSKDDDQNDESPVSYADTLLELELPLENRKLKEDEIVSLCSEFLNAGTDTTSTSFEWTMANIVKYRHVQERLFEEIKAVVGDGAEDIKEEDLQRMPYLKAVILEGLRRHPPGHFVLPHAVTEDVVLGGYFTPKNCSLNFMVAEMGLDSEVWEDPTSFKPERFLKEDGSVETFDMACSKEIKMMPFGVGRRMCPGYGLAMLHLEYFVANLIWKFKWTADDELGVDLVSEKLEFTMVMKNPLHARISPRFIN
ncbi:hypothetical protein FNV43_RR10253 [Rhamnella rubrinervis]|uniref:Cytochrome P450 n=1 Tax=Rhamnella rubrinervis TaxID=2594499 RepID=A0A8K0MKK6_9ROSA|nr:hypothetical protein FNV43_RR10253 [Rhamnella rubrinervis]